MSRIFYARKLVCGALFALLLLPMFCLWGAAADYIAANGTRGNGLPYYIMVNRAQNTVTVYGLDEEGCYTVPVKAMVCSTGRKGHATPLGTYSITGKKRNWNLMFDGSYGQYSTQFYGNFLFHSVCYSKADPSTLLTEEYNMLGDVASLGCVRLQTADAKWIFDNCAAGTKVTVYDGTDPGPLGKPEKAVAYIPPELDIGWDPTDPREDNPWNQINLSAGAMPFTDVSENAWYYEDVRYVYENGIFSGTALGTFSPNDPVTRAMAVRVLYRMAGEPYGSGGSWYSAALRWAYRSGIIESPSGADLRLDRSITRQDLAALLRRYASGGADADAFDFLYSRRALTWALENGVLTDESSRWQDPYASVTRAEAAAIFHRYDLYLADRVA